MKLSWCKGIERGEKKEENRKRRMPISSSLVVILPSIDSFIIVLMIGFDGLIEGWM